MHEGEKVSTDTRAVAHCLKLHPYPVLSSVNHHLKSMAKRTSFKSRQRGSDPTSSLSISIYVIHAPVKVRKQQKEKEKSKNLRNAILDALLVPRL